MYSSCKYVITSKKKSVFMCKFKCALHYINACNDKSKAGLLVNVPSYQECSGLYNMCIINCEF